MKIFFHSVAHGASKAVGSAYAFIAALVLLVGWLATGPLFDFSDTWQLIINTFTTIVTFLMVFLIQNTQNRDSLGLHLKLDELIRATQGARNTMIDLAKLSDQQLTELEREFERICAQEAGAGPEGARNAASAGASAAARAGRPGLAPGAAPDSAGMAPGAADRAAPRPVRQNRPA